ncbi:MAG: hypothetical protein LBL46_03725 [Rickettsiales bacterium]|jgi:hypothetical protein|nr:hypothetical protein [Rickettsiales bacterium]
MKKLIAIFLLAPMVANGAKLCKLSFESYAYSSNGAAPHQYFAFGAGCGNAAKAGADVSTFCATRRASGDAYCLNGVKTGSYWDSWLSDSSPMNPDGYAGGTNCICRITWPIVLPPVFLFTGPCIESCALECGKHGGSWFN